MFGAVRPWAFGPASHPNCLRDTSPVVSGIRPESVGRPDQPSFHRGSTGRHGSSNKFRKIAFAISEWATVRVARGLECCAVFSDATDESGSGESENHLMDRRRGDPEKALHVGLGRCPPVDSRAGINESQVLALLVSEVDYVRRMVRQGGLIHQTCFRQETLRGTIEYRAILRQFGKRPTDRSLMRRCYRLRKSNRVQITSSAGFRSSFWIAKGKSCMPGNCARAAGQNLGRSFTNSFFANSVPSPFRRSFS